MNRFLIKVARELGVGTSELVAILRTNGFQIDNKPTARVSDEAFKVLTSEVNRIQIVEKEPKVAEETLKWYKAEGDNKISVGGFCRIHNLSFSDFISVANEGVYSLQSDIPSDVAEEIMRLKSEGKEIEETYPRGTIIETKILDLVYPQGLVVEFDRGYKGYIGIRNLASSIVHAEHIFDSFKPGGAIKVVVYSYDHINKVCHLSRRHTMDYITASLQQGDVARGRVIEKLKSKCIVQIETNELGLSNLCHENPIVRVLGYNEVKGIYNLREYVEESEIKGVKLAGKKNDDFSFIEPDLINYLVFEKSPYGVAATLDEKAFIREQFRSDEKLFAQTLYLKLPIFVKFFNNYSWDEFKKEAGEDNLKEALGLLAKQDYWIRFQFNEVHQSEELILHNEETFIKAKVTDLDSSIALVVDKFSLGRKNKRNSRSKKWAANSGVLLNQAELVFLSPYDNIPFDAQQESVIEALQNKFRALDILKSLKERIGGILQTEGEALKIFERFLDYQISLERENEREPINIPELRNYPSSEGWRRYLIISPEKLEVPEGGVEIVEKIIKEKANEAFNVFAVGRIFEESDQWILQVRDGGPDLTSINKDIYLRERLQITHLESQKEIIEDFLNKKIKVGHIEKLLVDPTSIKPPRAATIEFQNPDLANTFINEPGNKQIEAVRKGVGNQNILLIQGPPGTGKTTVIAEIVQQLTAKGETILIASQGHVAVDNVLEKLAGSQGLLMTRIGSEEKINPNLIEFQEEKALQRFTQWYALFVENQLKLTNDILENESVKEKITEYCELYPEYLKGVFRNYHHKFHQILLLNKPNGLKDLQKALEEWKSNISIQKEKLIKALFYKHLNIAFGTCIGLKNSRDLKENEVTFDTLILDEAGKANMAETFVAISLAKKVILVGDQKQLPPYLDSSLIDPEDDKSFPNSIKVNKIEFEKLKEALSSSFFEFLVDKIKKGDFPKANLVMLDIQHRMHPTIGNLVSESFYGSKVKSAEHTYDNRILLPSPFDKEIIFVDTSNDSNPYEKKLDGTSYINELEAAYITREIVPKLLDGGISASQVAVISPYKYQVDLINRRLLQDISNEEVTVETLDSFQGKEFDIIIISFTRSHLHHRVGFLDDARRLNVALSRAKKKLILVGNSKTLCSPKSHFDKFYNYTDLFNNLVSLSSNSETGNFFQLSDQFSFVPAKPKTSFGLEVGEIVEGKIKAIEEYGAFIDLKEAGSTGLCYIRNLAHGRISHPTEVVSLGEEVRVKVLDIHEGRISLGLKQLFPHPWKRFVREYKVGQIVKGKVVEIKEYGAFLEIIPGVEGLIHKSQFSRDNNMLNPKSYLKKGDDQEAVLKSIDYGERKIALSIKDLRSDPWRDIEARFPLNSIHRGKITNIQKYRLFVELETQVTGVIHISHLKTVDLKESFVVGKMLEVSIFKLDVSRKRISLKLRHPHEPSRATKAGKKRKKVSRVTLNGIEIKVGQMYAGKYSSETNDYFKILLPKDVVGYLKRSRDAERRIKGLDQLPKGHKIIRVQIEKIEEDNTIYLTLS